MKTILTNCTVIDCTGHPPMPDMTVTLEDNRIAGLAPGNHPESGAGEARVFDLNGGFLLPGLWTVHTHLGAIFPDAKRLTFGESMAECAIRAGRNCMDALRQGIVGIRSLGDRDFIDVAWKRAFNMSLFVGPHLFVAGNCIIATGGHGHGGDGCLEIDGPYEMRKAVREQLKHGADVIKLAVTGGVATSGESMQESQLTLDEMQAATEVAHEKGKLVTVHAGGPAGIKNAIRAGVDCIEHGYYLDDEAIGLMAEHGTYYVPTLFVTQYEDFMRRSGMADYQVQKAAGAAIAHRTGFQKALQAGVKIACGADSSPIGDNTLVEIEQLVKAGMTEMQALMAATKTAAELCSAADHLGTIECGKLADLIVLSANPLEDIAHVRKLTMVFRDGKPVDTRVPEGQKDFWELYF
jgi:imidazolonepropionase-like amidohydrolase